MKEWICREISTSTGDNENGVLMIEKELIRCKDCIHAVEYLEGKYLCYRSGGRITTAEGFCDKGEEE